MAGSMFTNEELIAMCDRTLERHRLDWLNAENQKQSNKAMAKIDCYLDQRFSIMQRRDKEK